MAQIRAKALKARQSVWPLDAALYFHGEAPDRRDSLDARISILSRLQRWPRFFVVT
jgi:hypothetical protein